VRALVICDTGPGYRNVEAREKWNENAENRAKDLEARGLEALNPRSAEVRRAMSEHQSAQGLAHAARGMLAQSDSSVIDLLPEIAVPTVIIVGDEDEPFIGASNYMAKKIPGARMETIAGAGHASNIDQPEAFDRVLGEFLASLPEE
jgi:pimeloyl-ACP methyl ester carboxylesterase